MDLARSRALALAKIEATFGEMALAAERVRSRPGRRSDTPQLRFVLAVRSADPKGVPLSDEAVALLCLAAEVDIGLPDGAATTSGVSRVPADVSARIRKLTWRFRKRFRESLKVAAATIRSRRLGRPRRS